MMPNLLNKTLRNTYQITQTVDQPQEKAVKQLLSIQSTINGQGRQVVEGDNEALLFLNGTDRHTQQQRKSRLTHLPQTKHHFRFTTENVSHTNGAEATRMLT